MQTDRAVIIDYLAFSAPLSCMKSVHTFPEPGHEWRKYQFLPCVKAYRCAAYQDLPDVGVVYASSADQIQLRAEEYNKALSACLHARLRRFLAAVFGLVVGPARGTGGFAYEDSAVLYSDEGGSEHFGMIYWGGNNGTFYVQIGGQGCTHVMSGTTPQKIHKWFTHLDITSLKRLDLAVDDYDEIFTCSNALNAYKDDAFYSGMGPKPKLGTSNEIDADGCYTKEIVNVGSRQSRIYWRVYNKALEQKVSGSWYRSEVELKGVPSDVLLDTQGIFTGICAYAASINPTPPASIPVLLGRKSIDAIEAKVRWLRTQASATITKVINFYEGDVEAALSMILREEHVKDKNTTFDLPPVYQTLMMEKVRNMPCPLF
ncbi:replication initiation factor domain-containing protein [Sodalis endosymbiont of Spalangia cameroni]|uniref:replication initiation factor domain-containing protein n=1 Tax=Sodalis praecaptivus TaxID=1239307 RepID=UPI0031F936A0